MVPVSKAHHVLSAYVQKKPGLLYPCSRFREKSGRSHSRQLDYTNTRWLSATSRSQAETPCLHIVFESRFKFMYLSVIPSAFPEPIWPDFYCCHKFYAEPSPARLSDCKQAFNFLPNGSSLIPWPMHAHGDDPHFLPYIVKHGW